MTPPKKYIIFGNADYKGWVWLYDSNSWTDVVQYERKYLRKQTWQYVITETIELVGYENE